MIPSHPADNLLRLRTGLKGRYLAAFNVKFQKAVQQVPTQSRATRDGIYLIIWHHPGTCGLILDQTTIRRSGNYTAQ